MSYEFNISKNGKHVFATHERSCNDQHKALELWQMFEQRFPESEGYKVTCTEFLVRGIRFNDQADLFNPR